MSKRSIQFIVLLIIFSVFLFFRLYNLDKRISFGWDQEQFANQVKQLITFHKPLLIGPRALSDKGFFLGPYFDYILVPFFLLTNLHPSAYFLFIITYNIVFFVLAYLILKNIFSVYHALLFLVLWAINPLIARYDSIAWNPIFIPLGVLIIWYLLKKIYGKDTPWLFIGLGVTLGIFVNMHVQFVILLVFTIVFFFVRKIKISFGSVMLSTCTFIAAFVPLFIFDLRHQFLNTHSLLNFITQPTANSNINFFSWLPVFANVTEPLIYFTNTWWVIVFYLVISFAFLYSWRTKKGFLKSFYFSSLAVWLIFPLFFAKYGRRPSEYYFLFIYPFIYIIVCDLLTRLHKMSIVCVFILLVFVLNYHPLMENIRSDLRSLYYEDLVVKNLTTRLHNKKFNISFTTPPGGDSGFRYLIDYYHINQTGDWNDPLVQIKWPCGKKCEPVFGVIGEIIPAELE